MALRAGFKGGLKGGLQERGPSRGSSRGGFKEGLKGMGFRGDLRGSFKGWRQPLGRQRRSCHATKQYRLRQALPGIPEHTVAMAHSLQ